MKFNRFTRLLLVFAITASCDFLTDSTPFATISAQNSEQSAVRAWQEDVVIPTYEIGQEEKNPMFLEKRVYQGSSGVVYPYPVIEKISDTAVPKHYDAVFLENEYIKVMILPELGGRVQMAYDKIKDRHFIYYNQVVKPALVGLTGPWISGGIEINWPQHHRPSTFLPQDWRIEQLPDGGVTVWVGERERMFHQKGMAGYTLRPKAARLEIRGQIYNPTPVPQTFLWWANPAVKVNDWYQSVFPQDVNAVFDHGKRDVSTFPIATGTYYKVDYSAGVDISRYKNIPVPTSYMAVKSKYDFVGGYENDTRAGVLHVANHNVSTGKKQWTWGNGDFGRAWDRNLTDEDGPYIELMTGMYCDNQPDFSWLQPYEEKQFTQYFIPYRELGVVKNACREVLFNIDTDGRDATLRLFATEPIEVNIVLTVDGKPTFSRHCAVSPENMLEERIKGVTSLDNCRVEITTDERTLLVWQPEPKSDEKPIPDPAKPAAEPQDIASCEQLFLTGQHIEQYRHATYNATDYYLEALRREPTDIRNNNAMGLWLLRRGRFAEAEPYLQRAVDTQMERNPNPYDGEPLYNLALSQYYQGRFDEAYANFYKACWNAAQQAAGYFALARISTLQGRYEDALYELDQSLARNWHNTLARHLKTAVLRRTGRTEDAKTLAQESLALDCLNTGCLFELQLLGGDGSEFKRVMRDEAHNYEELAVDYIDAGLYDEAVGLLELCALPTPMTHYYKGYALASKGDRNAATEAFAAGASADPAYCFPNALEAVLALKKAIEYNPEDSKACYYLGNLWYDKRQHKEAIACWERSVEIDPTFPTALRNLALGCFNKLGAKERAVELLERAFAADPNDARILMELDQLHKRLGAPFAERLARLDAHKEMVYERDDLYLEYATLLNQLDRYEEAKAMIDSRKFHPWEGGEGKVSAQYQFARVELAKQAIASKRYRDALALLKECYDYPHNLGEGKLAGAQENDFDYWSGRCYEALGKKKVAKEYYQKASKGISVPSDAMYYNDQKPDKIFYQGLALLRLGRKAEAEERFNRLVDYGRKNVGNHVKIDYFAVSLPDLQIWEGDLDVRNRVHCNYMAGLGCLGLGDKEAARSYLNAAAGEDPNHQGVQYHIEMIETLNQ